MKETFVALIGPDIGDAIAALPSLRCKCNQLGKKAIVHLVSVPGTKGFSVDRFNATAALFRTAPYIESVHHEMPPEGTTVELDYRDFRSQWNPAINLVEMLSNFVGIPSHLVDLSPWLHIAGDIPQHGKIVLCRAARRWGQLPWWRICANPSSLFLGIQDDFDNFCQYAVPFPPGSKENLRFSAEFMPTNDLVEAARIILGAKIFLVNQTALFWVACAVGARNIVQERINLDSTVGCLGGRVRYVDHQNDLSAKEIDSWNPQGPMSMADRMKRIKQ